MRQKALQSGTVALNEIAMRNSPAASTRCVACYRRRVQGFGHAAVGVAFVCVKGSGLIRLSRSVAEPNHFISTLISHGRRVAA
jgi:hypothetical protein